MEEAGPPPPQSQILDTSLYADNVNMFGENLQAIMENAEMFIKPSKVIGLDVNSEKTKYMITSRLQNLIQNQNIVIGNLSTVVARVLIVF